MSYRPSIAVAVLPLLAGLSTILDLVQVTA